MCTNNAFIYLLSKGESSFVVRSPHLLKTLGRPLSQSVKTEARSVRTDGQGPCRVCVRAAERRVEGGSILLFQYAWLEP